LSNTIFTATNIGGLKVALHSHTSIVNIGSVDFDGTLTQSGSSYVLLVHGMASFKVDGFSLANASLVIDNSHLAITVHEVYAEVFTADFAGSMTSAGVFSLQATAIVGLAGFSLSNAHLDMNNTRLQVSGSANAFVATVAFV